MKVLFISSAASPKVIAHLNRVNKRNINYVQQKWDYAFSRALSALLKSDFKGYSYQSVSAFPKYSSELYSSSIQMEEINTECLGGFNIPIIKQLIWMFRLRTKVRKYVKSEGAENIVILTNCIQYMSSWPIMKVARKFNVKTATIVPDLPDYDMCTYHGSKVLVNRYKSLNLKYKKAFDGYVCFSEHQMNYLNGHAPYIVMEGFCTPEFADSEIKKSPKFVVMYAGGVRTEYGIKELLEGFLLADIPDSELWIFGNGDYVNELKKVCDPRVKYWGVLDKAKVLEYEQMASLLVNPRPTGEAFSYLSFPSKILEYMASGTTVMTSRLGSIPREYDDYLLYFDSIDAQSIANCLVNARNNVNLNLIGLKARTFVLKNKNVDVQAKRVVEFLEILAKAN